MSWFTSFFSSTSNPPPKITEPQSEDIHPLTTPPIEKRVQTESAKPEITNSTRPNQNKIVFGAGVAFFAFSLLITRRAFVRRRLASNPAFYTNAPGHHAEQAKSISGAREALEALNLATLNVLSVSMMVTGGSMWYLNINSLDDARKLLRGGLGVDGTGKTEAEAEEEFEEWMATVLARKDAKEAGNIKNTSEKRQER